MIRVMLPAHLKNLTGVTGEVLVDAGDTPTQRKVLDALEDRYPVLKGTIRDHEAGKRRPFVRFYACEEDLSHDPPDAPLPPKVVAGEETFYVIGAIAGG